jgi:hypothetical protein
VSKFKSDLCMSFNVLVGRFNTAYCTLGEDEACVDLFGKADVAADTLPELGRAIVQKWAT